LRKGLEKLEKRDPILLRVDVNERSLTHKLAEYIEKEFPGYDVDCEYNRNDDQLKQLHLPSDRRVRINDIRAKTVFPDIIVHRRDTDENILVIEVKKINSPKGKAFDLMKLHAFKNELGYKHAVFVQIGTGPSTPRTFTLEFV
jgi:hypothetical protein